MNTPVTPAGLADLIAAEITRQGQEHDGLGDAESIVLMGKLPTINLVELAEAILAARARVDVETAEDIIMRSWLDFDVVTGRELAHRGMAQMAAQAIAAAAPLRAPAPTCQGLTFARETLRAHGCQCPQPGAPASARCSVCPLGDAEIAPGASACTGPEFTRELFQDYVKACGAPNGVRIEQRCVDCPDRRFELGAGLA